MQRLVLPKVTEEASKSLTSVEEAPTTVIATYITLNSQIQFEFHYGSMSRVLATFPIDLNFNYLNEYLQQHFRLTHCAIVYRRGDRYSYVDNGLFIWEVFLIF